MTPLRTRESKHLATPRLEQLSPIVESPTPTSCGLLLRDRARGLFAMPHKRRGTIADRRGRQLPALQTQGFGPPSLPNVDRLPAQNPFSAEELTHFKRVEAERDAHGVPHRKRWLHVTNEQDPSDRSVELPNQEGNAPGIRPQERENPNEVGPSPFVEVALTPPTRPASNGTLERQPWANEHRAPQLQASTRRRIRVGNEDITGPAIVSLVFLSLLCVTVGLIAWLV